MKIQGLVMFAGAVVLSILAYNTLNKSVAGGRLPSLAG